MAAIQYRAKALADLALVPRASAGIVGGVGRGVELATDFEGLGATDGIGAGDGLDWQAAAAAYRRIASRAATQLRPRVRGIRWDPQSQTRGAARKRDGFSNLSSTPPLRLPLFS